MTSGLRTQDIDAVDGMRKHNVLYYCQLIMIEVNQDFLHLDDGDTKNECTL